MTVRLDDMTIETIDAWASYFTKSDEMAKWIAVGRKVTRSDMIRACVIGYINDHPATAEKVLKEYRNE